MAGIAYDYRYTPILTGREAEIVALGELRFRTEVLPILDVPPLQRAAAPSRRAIATGQPPPKPQTLETRSRTLARNMKKRWESGRRFYVDLNGIAGAVTSEGAHPVDYVFNVLRQAELRPAPCLSMDARTDEVEAVRRTLDSADGLCLRVTLATEPDEAEQWLIGAMRTLDATFSDVAVVLDAGRVADLEEQRRRGAAHLNRWGGSRRWWSVSFASTSAPVIGGIKGPVRAKRLERPEIQLWRDVMGDSRVRPAFADYGVTGPRPRSDDPGYAASPSLRYSTEDAWIVWKGRRRPRPLEGGSPTEPAQFNVFCRDLIASGQHAGGDASWGDAEILAHAKLAGRRSNEVGAGRAIALATSHHLDTTATVVVTE